MEVGAAVEALEVLLGELAVVLVDQAGLLGDWRSLAWGVNLLRSTRLRLEIAQVELLLVLILDHAVESNQLMMKIDQVLWSLAVIESRNASHPEIKRTLDAQLFFEDGGKVLLFLAALTRLIFPFIQ
jgi:hypothetical protein